jgi:purine-nucleoside phosphorylase
MRVLGLSCVTNMAAGVLETPLEHRRVLQSAGETAGKIDSLLSLIIPHMP